MKKLLGLLSLASLLSLVVSGVGGAQNLVFNPGFDMTPWDTGWVSDTSAWWGGSDVGDAVATIQADSGRSLPNSCYLYAYAFAAADSPHESGSAGAEAIVSQMFEEIINCSCEVYVKFSIRPFYCKALHGVGAAYGICNMQLFINGEWDTIWEVYTQDMPGIAETLWTEICTTFTQYDTVSGIKFSIYSRASGFSSDGEGHGGIATTELWVDDVYTGAKTGVEEVRVSNLIKLIAFPNPFTNRIEFEVKDYGLNDLKLEILDITGRVARTLLASNSRPPITKISWDGRDKRGELMPSGVYFAKLKTGKKESCIKITFLGGKR